MRFRPGTSAADRAAANRAERAQEIRSLLVPRVFLLRLPAGRDVGAAAAAYERNPNVEYAEPNFIDRPAATVPNDPSFGQLWGLHNTGQSVNGTSGTVDADVDAPEAWDLGTGGSGVTVGVADTGIAYDHPDLASNIWTNSGESGGGKESNGIDDDGNGWIDDVHGYDFAAGDSDPRDDQDHGSHVAGTIGAVGNNGVGVTGVNWQVGIASLRICSPNPLVACSHAAQADAYAYAAQMGFKVVSASISGSSSGQTVANAIAAASDTLFVFAAGNETSNNDQSPRYPCQYGSANIVCVAASDQSDQLAWFSNYGATSVDLVSARHQHPQHDSLREQVRGRLRGERLRHEVGDGRHEQHLGAAMRDRQLPDGRQSQRQLPQQHRFVGTDRERHEPLWDGGLPPAVPDVPQHEGG